MAVPLTEITPYNTFFSDFDSSMKLTAFIMSRSHLRAPSAPFSPMQEEHTRIREQTELL